MDNTIKMCKLLTKLSSKDFKKNIQLNLYYVVMIVMYSAIMYGINIITRIADPPYVCLLIKSAITNPKINRQGTVTAVNKMLFLKDTTNQSSLNSFK